MWRLLVPLLLLIPSHASIVDEIVMEMDWRRALQYTSLFEIINTIVDSTGDRFEELRPSSKEEETLVKRQFVHFLCASASEQQEFLAGLPTTFGILAEKYELLRRTTHREYAKASGAKHVNALMPRPLDQGFIRLLLGAPVYHLLKRNMESYEQLGLTEAQFGAEINRTEAELKDVFICEAADSHRYEEYQLKKQLYNETRMDFAVRLMKNRDFGNMWDFTSPIELAESVLQSVWSSMDLFPDLRTPQDNVRKRTILQAAWMLTAEEQERDEVISRWKREFKPLSDLMRRAEWEMNKKEMYWQLMEPVFNHLEKQIADFVKRDLNQNQRRKVIKNKERYLTRMYQNDAADSIDPDVLIGIWRVEKAKAMRRLLILLFLPTALHASIVDEILNKNDLKRALQYTSMFEIANAIVDSVCKDFKELRPSSDEEMILVKRQFVNFIASPVSVQDELVAGLPTKFDILAAKYKQLRKIAQREFPELSEEGKKAVKDVPGYLNFKVIYKPIYTLLEKNIASYEKRGLTEKQIRNEVNRREKELMDLFHADDPENPNYDLYQVLKELYNTTRKDFARQLQQGRQFEKMWKYTSPVHLASGVLTTLWSMKYPELRLSGKEADLVRLQATWLLTTEADLREEVISRWEDEFKPLKNIIKGLYNIAQREFKKLSADEKKKVQDGEGLMRWLVLDAAFDHLEANIATFVKHGLDKGQIRTIIEKKERELTMLWRNDDLNSVDPDILTDIWLAEKNRMEENEKRQLERMNEEL